MLLSRTRKPDLVSGLTDSINWSEKRTELKLNGDEGCLQFSNGLADDEY